MKTKITAGAAKKTGAKSGAGDLDFVPVRSKAVLSRTNADGSVAIIRLDSDQYFFTLDGVSAELWNAINGKSNVAKIVEKMIDKHDLPAARFTKDVRKLISDLKKEGLIQIR